MAGVVMDVHSYNLSSEVIIVVDFSDSSQMRQEEMISFVEQIITESDGNHSIGVVTFGRDAHLAVAPRSNHSRIVEDLRASERPRAGATNIAAALELAREQIVHLEEGRIILLSDGLETDGFARPVVESIARQGIRVDSVFFPAETPSTEVRIASITVPLPTEISLNNPMSVIVNVQSARQVDQATLSLHPSSASSVVRHVGFREGMSSHIFDFTPTSTGLHYFRAHISSPGDVVSQNNIFYTYIYIDANYRVLLVEGAPNEAVRMRELLSQDFGVTTVNIADVSTDITDLLRYNQILLLNVSPRQMPEGFEEVLERYVYEFGGGVLTSGGINAYQQDHFIEGSPFERMLPVRAASNALPMGLVVLIDSTTSMVRTPENTGSYVLNSLGSSFVDWQNRSFPAMISSAPNGPMIPNPMFGRRVDGPLGAPATLTVGDTSLPTRLDVAIEGAIQASYALKDSDWMGVIHYNTNRTEHLPMTALTRRDYIQHRIRQPITVNSGAVMHAGITDARNMLMDMPDNIRPEVRHIMVLVDGDSGQWGTTTLGFQTELRRMYEQDGITFSFILIGDDDGPVAMTALNTMATTPAVSPPTAPRIGTVNQVFRTTLTLLAEIMAREVTVQAGQWLNDGIAPFRPQAVDVGTGAFSGLPDGEPIPQMPYLRGFFGTRAKQDATIVLRRFAHDDEDEDEDIVTRANIDPIYVEWAFGRGRVGSFTSDLSGAMSEDFLASETGRWFLLNVIRSLMSTSSMEEAEIGVRFNTRNLTTGVEIVANVAPGQTIVAELTNPLGERIMLDLERREDGAFIAIFEKETSGIYRLMVTTREANGELVSFVNTFVAFSYSDEYNMFWNLEEAGAFMTALAHYGGGRMLATSVVGGIFGAENERTTRTFDPRIYLLGLLIALFLLDILSRKFKFKWIHELIQDSKAKQVNTQPQPQQ